MLALAALAAQPIAGILGRAFCFGDADQPPIRKSFLLAGQKKYGWNLLDEPRARVLRIKTVNLDQKRNLHFPSSAAASPTKRRGISFLAVNFCQKLFLFFNLSFNRSNFAIIILFYRRNSRPVQVLARPVFTMPLIIFPREQNIWLNFIYLILGNEWLILILLAILSAYLIHRWRHKFPQFIILGSTAAVCW